jgi:hypothetical protein
MVARRENHIPVEVEIVLTDRDGREHRMAGRAKANHDWVPHACLNVHQVYYEYTADGRGPGYGVVEEATPIDMMTRGRA